MKKSMRSAELGSPGTTGLMLYRDAEGNVTERRIRVIRSYTSRNGVRYIEAFCSLKREERTFRVDRVVSFVPDYACAPPVASSVPAAVPAAEPGNGNLVCKIIFLPIILLFSVLKWILDKFFTVYWYAIAAVVVVLFLAAVFPEKHRGGSYSAYISYVPIAAVPRQVPAAAKPSVRPAPPPPSPAPRKLTAEELRRRDFTKTTGLTDFRLLRLYEAADLNGDGGISWDELASFQKELKKSYSYRSNATALSPDEFLRQGGGDCEDWALVTCGLLRYWRIDSYVGVFIGPTKDCGHAVALVYSRDKPGDKLALEAKGILSFEGAPIPDGYYVPVDYEVVGGLSAAVGPGYAFAGYHVPERIYRAGM